MLNVSSLFSVDKILKKKILIDFVRMNWYLKKKENLFLCFLKFFFKRKWSFGIYIIVVIYGRGEDF